MNILTVGLVIQDYALIEFTGMSKIVTLANVELPVSDQIGPQTTGHDLVAIYQGLPLDIQTKMYRVSLLNRNEVNLLYREVKLMGENNALKSQFNETRRGNFVFVATFLVLICSIGIAWLYHLNTVQHNDVIDADFTKGLVKVLQYLIKGFV